MSGVRQIRLVAIAGATATLVLLGMTVTFADTAPIAPAPACKTPEVEEEITKLTQDYHNIGVQIESEENDLYNDGAKLVQCANASKGLQGEEFEAQFQKCSDLKDLEDADVEEVNRLLRQQNAVAKRLKKLQALPACPIPPQVPPPPNPQPPPPQPPLPPQPPKQPPAAAPTHRTTCAPCMSLADRLNEAIDNYVVARDTKDPSQTTYLGQIKDIADQLGQCEKACYLPPAAPVMPSRPHKHPKSSLLENVLGHVSVDVGNHAGHTHTDNKASAHKSRSDKASPPTDTPPHD